jgi:hypothetical protein
MKKKRQTQFIREDWRNYLQGVVTICCQSTRLDHISQTLPILFVFSLFDSTLYAWAADWPPYFVIFPHNNELKRIC